MAKRPKRVRKVFAKKKRRNGPNFRISYRDSLGEIRFTMFRAKIGSTKKTPNLGPENDQKYGRDRGSFQILKPLKFSFSASSESRFHFHRENFARRSLLMRSGTRC